MSEYRKKKELKDKRKPRKGGKGFKSTPAPVLGAPVYLYHSDCCGEQATKTATVADRGAKLVDRKATLGTWKCSKCRKKAKVTRKLNKEEVNGTNF